MLHTNQIGRSRKRLILNFETGSRASKQPYLSLLNFKTLHTKLNMRISIVPSLNAYLKSVFCSPTFSDPTYHLERKVHFSARTNSYLRFVGRIAFLCDLQSLINVP